MTSCAHHGYKPVTSYCRRHEENLCIECLLNDHKDCIGDIEAVDTHQDAIRGLAGSLVQKFGNISEGVELWMRRGNGTLHKLKETEAKLASGIKQIRLKLIEQVNSLATDALEVINSIIEEHTDIIKGDIKGMQEINDRMLQMHALVRGFRETDAKGSSACSAEDVIAADKELNEIDRMFKENQLPQRDVNIKFYLAYELEFVRKNLITFGELSVQEMGNPDAKGEADKRPISVSTIPSAAMFFRDLEDGVTDPALFLVSEKPSNTTRSLYNSITDESELLYATSRPPALTHRSQETMLVEKLPDQPNSKDIHPINHKDYKYPEIVESTPKTQPGLTESISPVPNDDSPIPSIVITSDGSTDRCYLDSQNSFQDGKIQSTEPKEASTKEVAIRKKKTTNRDDRDVAAFDRQKIDSGFVSSPRTSDNETILKRTKHVPRVHPNRTNYLPIPQPRTSAMGRNSQSTWSLNNNQDPRSTPALIRKSIKLHPYLDDEYNRHSRRDGETMATHIQSDNDFDSWLDQTRTSMGPCHAISAQFEHKAKSIAETRKEFVSQWLPRASSSAVPIDALPNVDESSSEIMFGSRSDMCPTENHMLDNSSEVNSSVSSLSSDIVSGTEGMQYPRRPSFPDENLKTMGRNITAPMSRYIFLSDNVCSTKKKSHSLISGMCRPNFDGFFICDAIGDKVQLFDTTGKVANEYSVLQPFGCRHIGSDLVAVTSKQEKALIFFDVSGGIIRRNESIPLPRCSKSEIHGIGYTKGDLCAISCLNRVLIVDYNKHEFTTVQPTIPDSKWNKKFFQEVMFCDLSCEGSSLQVFASDVRRELVSSTDVRTNTVLWSVPISTPRDIALLGNVLFVLGKMRVSLLRHECGKTLMEIRTGVPKRPFALTNNSMRSSGTFRLFVELSDEAIAMIGAMLYAASHPFKRHLRDTIMK